MVVKSKFSPGQKVHIVDAKQDGRVSGVLVTNHGITYMCRWWDGTNFQENDFEDIELEPMESSDGFVLFQGDKKLDFDVHGETPLP
jgi:uncharacterized protein YodC (DUF2158 family)